MQASVESDDESSSDLDKRLHVTKIAHSIVGVAAHQAARARLLQVTGGDPASVPIFEYPRQRKEAS